MSLDLDDIAQLLAGSIAVMPVGRLIKQARGHMSNEATAILLSSQTVRHILSSHGDHLSPSDLVVIPQVIQQGLWLADRDRACRISYQEHDTGRHFVLAIKATATRRELFVATFHRSNRKQFERLLRRGNVLRPHL